MERSTEKKKKNNNKKKTKKPTLCVRACVCVCRGVRALIVVLLARNLTFISNPCHAE